MAAAAPAVNTAPAEEIDLPWASVALSLVATQQRRLEARTYLTDGYGLRRRIEDGPAHSRRISEVASVWQPSRLKGYVVPSGKGLPFLSAGQVFEARPRVRKWVAEPMVRDVASRKVSLDMLLMSCSGEVGKVTATYAEHLDRLITHDLLRIEAHDADELGWIYAYMKTPIFYSIARSAQYGHMIKHLEPEHVREMPIVMPTAGLRSSIGTQISQALKLRRRGRALLDDADNALNDLINPERQRIDTTVWQSVPVSEVLSGRRRLEAQYQRSEVRDVERLVASNAKKVVRLADVTESVRLENRFKRHYSQSGTPYRSASEIFDVNPPVTKRIYPALVPDPDRYYLTPGEMVMARSGQVYGLLGRVRMIPTSMAGVFGSDDLIRIALDESRIPGGYLQTFLSNETYGRLLVVRNASGTSIPHLDPVDIQEVPVPRFDARSEEAISDLALRGNELLADADELETRAITRATQLVAREAGLHGLAETLPN